MLNWWTALSESKKVWLVGLIAALLTGVVAAVPRLLGHALADRRAAAAGQTEHGQWLVETVRRDAEASRSRLRAARQRCDSCCQQAYQYREQHWAQHRAAQRLRAQNERLERQLQSVLSRQKVKTAP